MKLPVVFEDDYLLVFEKPPGLVVTSSETTKELSLEDILRTDRYIPAERSGIVHRLDKDTSGLLLVAKSNEVLQALQAQFKGREVGKEYLALVHGFIEKGGRVEAPIARNPGDREKFVVIQPHQTTSGEAREAVTEYEPLELRIMHDELRMKIFEDFSKIQMKKLITNHYLQFTLLSLKPQTGRTHQIRVHLKYLGFPIVGDSKYGGRKTARLDARWCPRQFLHAFRLEFTHPESGKRMSFESKLPEDLEKALEVLEKTKKNG